MEKTTFAAIACLAVLPPVAQAQFQYLTNGGTTAITRYTGPGGSVSIPSTINGLPVTTIEYEAFFSRDSVTSVTVPNSVTGIGASLFSTAPA